MVHGVLSLRTSTFIHNAIFTGNVTAVRADIVDTFQAIVWSRAGFVITMQLAACAYVLRKSTVLRQISVNRLLVGASKRNHCVHLGEHFAVAFMLRLCFARASFTSDIAMQISLTSLKLITGRNRLTSSSERSCILNTSYQQVFGRLRKFEALLSRVLQ